MKRALVAPGSALATGRIAQLVEQLTLNQRVQGSNPCAPTNEIKDLCGILQQPKNRRVSRGSRQETGRPRLGNKSYGFGGNYACLKRMNSSEIATRAQAFSPSILGSV